MQSTLTIEWFEFVAINVVDAIVNLHNTCNIDEYTQFEQYEVF